MHCLLQTEAQFGRVRQERWGPRLLDLDLLLFEDWQVDSAELTVPHPRLHERAFVLVPLQEIAPDWRHPNLGKTVAELATTVDHRGVQLLLPAQPEIRPQPVIAADLPLHSPHSDLSPGM
jgi:2-amino-4-hydroxy-6-hydroxymethyldihydropteridine diphosphokinase